MRININISFIKLSSLFVSTIMTGQILHHQTIASGGLMGEKSKQKQSIGQQSVIGLRKSDLGIVQQGFIHNTSGANFSSNNNFIKNNFKTLPIIIYPNPFNTTFNLKFTNDVKGNFKILISDLSGKIILIKDAQIEDSKITVDNFYFPEGFYFLHVSNEACTYKFKIFRKI